MATKGQLARQMYGKALYELSAGEKAAVTRAFNSQGASSSSATVTAEVGRIGVNGTQRCILSEGETVGELIEQSGFKLDSKKEGVVAQSTGKRVLLSEPVVHGETYVITPEIKSA